MWNVSRSDKCISKKSNLKFKYTSITKIYFISLRQESWIKNKSDNQRNYQNTILSFYSEKKDNKKIDALNKRLKSFEKNEIINETILKQSKKSCFQSRIFYDKKTNRTRYSFKSNSKNHEKKLNLSKIDSRNNQKKWLFKTTYCTLKS